MPDRLTGVNEFPASAVRPDVLALPIPDLPFALQLELTSHCNLRCVMCPLTTGTSSTSGDVGHVTEETWEEVLPVARRCQQVFIAGYGEPLTNPRCLDLLRDLDEHSVSMTIATNGLVLTDDIARQLGALRHLAQVNVSLDSPDPAIYHQLRGGNLRRALQGLRNLVEHLRPSQITVSSVLMAQNAASLVAFPELLAEMGVRHYDLQGVMDYNDFARSATLRDVIGSGAVVSRIREECERHGVYLVVGSEDRLELELADPAAANVRYHERPRADDVATRQCMVPWEVPFIDKNGTVFACCFAASANERPLGNLHEASFEDIWGGTAAQRFRTDLLDGHTTPDICRRCTVVPVGEHPMRTWAAELVPSSLHVSRRRVRFQVRNTGHRAWLPSDLIRVGTRDGESKIAHGSWPFPHRAASFREERVEPGDLATFSFRVNPAGEEVVQRFHLVVEGKLWLPEVHVDVTLARASSVDPVRLLHRLRRLVRLEPAATDPPVAGFAAQIVPGSVSVDGDKVRVQARNTGTRGWSHADQLYVGTADPRDGVSPFAHPTWRQPNRCGTFEEPAVSPGAIATFLFRIDDHDPAATGSFQLVADGYCWLGGTTFELP